MRRKLAALTLLTLALARGVAADPLGDTAKPEKYVQTEAPRLLCMPPAPPAKCIELPAGRFVSEDGWGRLDAEMRRLQDAETRLKAENASMRGSLDSWSPGWMTMLGTFVAGAAAGAYLVHKL